MNVSNNLKVNLAFLIMEREGNIWRWREKINKFSIQKFLEEENEGNF